MRVLVIDDEEMIRDMAQRILSRAGFEVVTANSGRRGLKLFSENPDQIGLVLLDLTTDDMPGLEALREMREICPDIPCIISSGHMPGADEIPDELNRNLRFLHKPYRASQLSELVSLLFSKAGQRA